MWNGSESITSKDELTIERRILEFIRLKELYQARCVISHLTTQLNERTTELKTKVNSALRQQYDVKVKVAAKENDSNVERVTFRTMETSEDEEEMDEDRDNNNDDETKYAIDLFSILTSGKDEMKESDDDEEEQPDVPENECKQTDKYSRPAQNAGGIRVRENPCWEEAWKNLTEQISVERHRQPPVVYLSYYTEIIRHHIQNKICLSQKYMDIVLNCIEPDYINHLFNLNLIDPAEITFLNNLYRKDLLFSTFKTNTFDQNCLEPFLLIMSYAVLLYKTKHIVFAKQIVTAMTKDLAPMVNRAQYDESFNKIGVRCFVRAAILSGLFTKETLNTFLNSTEKTAPHVINRHGRHRHQHDHDNDDEDSEFDDSEFDDDDDDDDDSDDDSDDMRDPRRRRRRRDRGYDEDDSDMDDDEDEDELLDGIVPIPDSDDDGNDVRGRFVLVPRQPPLALAPGAYEPRSPPHDPRMGPPPLPLQQQRNNNNQAAAQAPKKKCVADHIDEDGGLRGLLPLSLKHLTRIKVKESMRVYSDSDAQQLAPLRGERKFVMFEDEIDAIKRLVAGRIAKQKQVQPLLIPRHYLTINIT